MTDRALASEHPTDWPEDYWPSQPELIAEGERLYQMYVHPLEEEHWGEFAAVSRDGRVLLGSELRELTERATAQLGRGHFAFRVGDKVVGRIR